MRTQISGFKDALYWLDENYGYFLTPILNMGDPEPDYECDTAYVTLDPSAPGRFRFKVNPDFAAACSTEELAGVLAHETMHVLLSHLTLSSQYSDARVFNMAADLIINDYLVDAGLELPDGVLRGIPTVGFDCALSDLGHVYHTLKQQPPQEGADGSDESSQSSDAGDGDGASEGGSAGEPCGFSERIREAIEAAAAAGVDTNGMTQTAEAAARQAVGDQLPGDLEDTLNDAKTSLGGGGAGDGFNQVEEMARETGTSINWIRLLEEVNPDIIKKPGPKRPPRKVSYHAPRRKVAAYYPDMILPNSRLKNKARPQDKKGNEKPTIVLALDTSGSIPREMVKKMTSLAAAVPEDLIEVYCCTFSTQYVPFNHRVNRNRVAAGGTCFSAVEEFIQKDVIPDLEAKGVKDAYPSAVVVITDGEASFSYKSPTSKQLKNNWTWVMIPHGRRSFPSRVSGSDRVKDLKDFI